MNQITLSKSPTKKDNKLLVIGSEAKNPLPTIGNGNFLWTDVAGLSWIFIDDPWDIEITHNPDKMRCS